MTDRITRNSTPRSIRRMLNRTANEDVKKWMLAVAPEAFLVLYEQLKSNHEDIKQRAALAILQWAIGKPATIVETDPAIKGRIYEVVAPHEAPSFDDWIAGLNNGANGKGNGVEGAARTADSTPLLPSP